MLFSRMMMTPTEAEVTWTHQLTIVEVVADQSGMGTGYGSITPSTFEGETIEYLSAYPGIPKVRSRFGGAIFGSDILFEIEGLAGTYTLAAISGERYGMPGTDPDDDAVAAYMVAQAGQTLGVNLTLA